MRDSVDELYNMIGHEPYIRNRSFRFHKVRGYRCLIVDLISYIYQYLDLHHQHELFLT